MDVTSSQTAEGEEIMKILKKAWASRMLKHLLETDQEWCFDENGKKWNVEDLCDLILPEMVDKA